MGVAQDKPITIAMRLTRESKALLKELAYTDKKTMMDWLEDQVYEKAKKRGWTYKDGEVFDENLEVVEG